MGSERLQRREQRELEKLLKVGGLAQLSESSRNPEEELEVR